MRRRGNIAAYPHIVWSVLFIIAPLLFVLYYTFTDGAGDPTLENIQRIGTSNYLLIFTNSLCMALIATVICLVIAYPLAYIFSRMEEKTQRIMMVLIMLPLWMNFLITTYSWMTLLEDTGIINTLLGLIGIDGVHMINTPGAVIVGMVFCFLPYMIMPIYSVMAGIDPKIVEAAKDLGCSDRDVLLRVIMPMSLSGVISGITMVFVPSISTFYISQKLGDGKILLVGDVIERQIQAQNNYNTGAALSLVLMVLIIVSLALMKLFAGESDGNLYV